MKRKMWRGIHLPIQLETTIIAMQDQAYELIERDEINNAIAKIWGAWNMLPEPKFNSHCSDALLCNFIEILTLTGANNDAKILLQKWISDLHIRGMQNRKTTPFILLGETFLYLNKIDKAKEQFYQAVEYGAGKRNFCNKPKLYYDIAKKRITDNLKIEAHFKKITLINRSENFQQLVLTKETILVIEDLGRQAIELLDSQNYSKGIKVLKRALRLIPLPQNTHFESQWLETALGEACFLLEDFDNAIQHYAYANNNVSLKAYKDPFIMLRLGQLFFEKALFTEALFFLTQAYQYGGIEIFKQEQTKYFCFLEKNIELTQKKTEYNGGA